MKAWFNRHRLFAAAVWLVVVGMLVPAKSNALFFDIVFDPSSYATLGSILSSNASLVAKSIAEYNQLVLIYTNAFQAFQFEQMMRMTLSHPTRQMWMTALLPVVNNYTQSHYGETIAWPQVMNGVPANTPYAWTSATVPFGSLAAPFGGGFPVLPTDQRQSGVLTAQTATVEMTDGASIACATAVSQYRGQAPIDDLSVQSLQSLQLDDSDTSNTTAAQATLSNGAAAQAINEARSQGKLQACLVEQQIVANKAERDRLVVNMNYAAHLQQSLNAHANDWDGNVSTAINGFRVP